LVNVPARAVACRREAFARIWPEIINWINAQGAGASARRRPRAAGLMPLATMAAVARAICLINSDVALASRFLATK
jgi:hypothetical protein